MVPADKSIAHRVALFAALRDEPSMIENFPSSADPRSTLGCLRQLGVCVHEDRPGHVRITGGVLREASTALDCGNSGTTMRLLAGALAGQPFQSTLTGDDSLHSRPMERIAAPLRQMLANVTLTRGRAPIRIKPSSGLNGITYTLPVASAQVKSCVLLAGLYANGPTTVIEKERSRDHTERILGLEVEEVGGRYHITIEPGHTVPAPCSAIPLDFSAAAFFLVAATIVGDAVVTMPGVGMNPTRTALLDVLRAMGADITIDRMRDCGGEPVGDLTVRSAGLHAVSVGGSVIPGLIDEIPILAVAAACAEGKTIIRDAAELRVKETDRIHALATNLRSLGVDVEEFPDGLAITGNADLQGTAVDSFGDHRIAMAMGIAGLVAAGKTSVHGAGAASVSYPEFWATLKHASGVA